MMFNTSSAGKTVSKLGLFMIGLAYVTLTNSHAQLPPRKAEPDTFYTSLIHRRKAQARLQELWQQRGQKRVARYILPFANDSAINVQYNAIKMLGRLEDPVALPTLQKLANGSMARFPLDSSHTGGLTTYPLLQIVVGRIKARNLTGKRKIEVAVKELGLDFPSLVRLSRRINNDQYGSFRVGYPVLEEVVDILYRQKKRGIAVDDLIRSLSLRPAQRALLSAASLTPQQQTKKLLGYLTQARAMGGDEASVLEYWKDLGPAGRSVALPFAKNILQRPPKEISAWNMVPVLESMARNGDKSALTLLKTLAKNQRNHLGVLADRAIENLK